MFAYLLLLLLLLWNSNLSNTIPWRVGGHIGPCWWRWCCGDLRQGYSCSWPPRCCCCCCSGCCCCCCCCCSITWCGEWQHCLGQLQQRIRGWKCEPLDKGDLILDHHSVLRYVIISQCQWLANVCLLTCIIIISLGCVSVCGLLLFVQDNVCARDTRELPTKHRLCI